MTGCESVAAAIYRHPDSADAAVTSFKYVYKTAVDLRQPRFQGDVSMTGTYSLNMVLLYC